MFFRYFYKNVRKALNPFVFGQKMNEFAETEQKSSLNHVFKKIICFKF